MDLDVLAQLAHGLGAELLDRLLVVLDEGLLQQALLRVELAHTAFQHLLLDLGRLALVDLLAVTMMIAAGLGCFVWPGELGLEGDLNLPFAIIVVSGLPWTPLALFSLVVMPLREMRGDVGQSPLGAGITAARQPARDC